MRKRTLHSKFRKDDKNINTHLKYNRLNAKLKMSTLLVYETENNEPGKMKVPLTESQKQLF